MNDLFERPLSKYAPTTEAKTLVRRTDPTTSVEAACSVDATKLEREVCDAIATFGPAGCISDEVCAALPHLSVVTVTPRFKKLVEKNLIAIIGKRKGRSGRNQQVMRAV